MSETLREFSLTNFVKSKLTTTPRIVLLGQTGTGKSYFGQKLCSEYLTHHNRIFVLDPKREDNHLKILKRDTFFENEYFMRRILSISVNNAKVENFEQISEWAACIAWEFAPSILYAKETVEYIPAGAQMARSAPNFYRIVQQGRAQRCGYIVEAQMRRDLNPAFSRQANAIFQFPAMEFELKQSEDYFGFASGSLQFEMPTPEEFNAGILKEMYCFYLIQPGLKPQKFMRMSEGLSVKKVRKPSQNLEEESAENASTFSKKSSSKANLRLQENLEILKNRQ